MTIMQYEPELFRDVIQMLTNHGLEIVSVDLKEGELVVRIPKI